MAGEVGLTTSKGQMDDKIGQLCILTRDLISQWLAAVSGLSSMTDADILALGYDAAGLAKVRALQAAAVQFVSVVTGAAALPVAHDARIEMSQWWGPGF